MKCLLPLVISSAPCPFLCYPSFGILGLLSLVALIIHPVPAFTGSNTAAAESQVSVLYAGSLGNLMEVDIGPSFTRATGYKYLGEAKGSVLSANLIKDKLRTPDVFISADPKVNQRLMGNENGNLVRWYATIFGNEMVLGYNPNSRFAAELKRVDTNDTRLYEILQEKGFRLGRGDPELEPKGYRTLFLFDLAERLYQRPGLAEKILSNVGHPALVFPEEQLVARLEAGQLDAGIFYRNEVAEQSLPFIKFPRELNLSEPELDPYYGKAVYLSPKGAKYVGSAIVYSITILETSQNRQGAIALVNFLLSDEGRKIVEKHALRLLQPLFSGEIDAAPPTLQTALNLKKVGSP